MIHKTLIPAAALGLALTLPAWAGSPAVERGRAIAEEWCGPCHQVSPDQAVAPDPTMGAPDFVTIARRYPAPALASFMAEEHEPMPTYRLWDDEKADLGAYLDHLRNQ